MAAATQPALAAGAGGAFPMGVPLHEALTLLIDFGPAELARQGDFIRVLFHGLAPDPDVLRGLRGRYAQDSYGALAAWIRDGATVLLGSFGNVRVVDTFLGERPGRLSIRRFRDEWVDMSTRALQP